MQGEKAQNNDNKWLFLVSVRFNLPTVWSCMTCVNSIFMQHAGVYTSGSPWLHRLNPDKVASPPFLLGFSYSGFGALFCDYCKKQDLGPLNFVWPNVTIAGNVLSRQTCLWSCCRQGCSTFCQKAVSLIPSHGNTTAWESH